MIVESFPTLVVTFGSDRGDPFVGTTTGVRRRGPSSLSVVSSGVVSEETDVNAVLDSGDTVVPPSFSSGTFSPSPSVLFETKGKGSLRSYDYRRELGLDSGLPLLFNFQTALRVGRHKRQNLRSSFDRLRSHQGTMFRGRGGGAEGEPMEVGLSRGVLESNDLVTMVSRDPS